MRLMLSPAAAIASRIVAVVLAGYAATVGMVALLAILLALLLGMVRSEAIVLMSMIGFLGYAGIIIWGFAEHRLRRIWMVLGATAVASNGAALVLAPFLSPVGGS